MRGFTLMEVLVVLVLVGLISAMVAPNLQRLAGGIERATRRDGVLADIGALSYRAYALGQSFELNNETQGQLLRDGSPLVALPKGWRLQLVTPITYSMSGFCSGGQIVLVGPDSAPETLELSSPDCRVNGNVKR